MMNENLFNKEFPKIGDDLNEFITIFGEPVKLNSTDTMLNSFDVQISNSSYLVTLNLDGSVYNVSWTLPVSYDEAKFIAEKFLPWDAELNFVVNDLVEQRINADRPISIYDYSSQSVKAKSGYVSNEEHKGFITIYLSKEDGNKVNFVIALGREELILKD